MSLALLRMYLRLGGSPVDRIGSRLLVRAINAADHGFEILQPGMWWSPLRVRRTRVSEAV